MNRFIILLAVMTIALTSGVVGRGQTEAAGALKEVKVFFYFIGKDGTDEQILPVKRQVSAAAPLYPAIEAILEGPTAAEKALGYTTTRYGPMKLLSVKFTKTTARIDFSREILPNSNPGDLETLRFREAVMRTAEQFPSVKKVIVCVNGMNEFGVGMEIDRPIPCPKSP